MTLRMPGGVIHLPVRSESNQDPPASEKNALTHCNRRSSLRTKQMTMTAVPCSKSQARSRSWTPWIVQRCLPPPAQPTAQEAARAPPAQGAARALPAAQAAAQKQRKPARGPRANTISRRLSLSVPTPRIWCPLPPVPAPLQPQRSKGKH